VREEKNAESLNSTFQIQYTNSGTNMQVFLFFLYIKDPSLISMGP